MEFLLVLAVLLGVVLIVSGPLRRSRPRVRGAQGGAVRLAGSGEADFERESDLGELEAAREAKYREIRDAQLDYDTGKLSPEDFEALDTGLRSEALEILQRLDRLRAPGAAAQAAPGPGAPE